jgi:hypothetical protein
MPDAPTDDGDDRSSDASKLELPSLKLPGFGRRRSRARSTPAEPALDDTAETAPLVVPPAAPVAEPQPAPPAAAPAAPWLDDTAVVPVADAADETVPDPAEPRPTRGARRRPDLPPLAGGVAALVTGALVGLEGALLTYLSLRGCEAVRGTESCGGPGVLLLVVILVVMVLLGGVVLAALHVSEPRGTSLLAVGVLGVVVLLVPQDALFSAWTFVVVPVVGAAAYALARWVTHLHVEAPSEHGPAHDVR